MFTSPGEIAFSIGNISIHYYGLCISFGIIIGLLLAYFVCKKFYKDLNPDIIFDVAIPVIIGGIIGARLYYCLLSSGYYIKNPVEILQIYKGGLSIHGGIIGGLVSGIIYAKKKNLPILKLCDIYSFALITGQIIGRWGNFFNSEAFGTPTNNFLKLFVPLEKRPEIYMNYDFFHPAFLYESFLNIIVLIILFFILRKNPKNGKIFFSYLILYSIVRLITESIRIDSILYINEISIAYIVSLIIIILSLLALRKI